MTSRIISKTRGSNKRRHASIQSLPRDVLLEVVAIVASQSFLDLHNIKMCCKDFLQVTEQNCVLQKVSLDNFPLIQWFPNEKALSFLKRCKESQNIEILFREGLREYFNYPNRNIGDGLERLKIAAQKGHKEAIKKVQYLTNFLWKNNEMLVRNQSPLCKSKITCKGWRVKKGRWLLLDDEDDDINLCEDCRWDHELEFFYQLFNVH
ncbi:hypothetical protein P8452_76949 [Trifolium repens]|nr:hypothetical protein P8452_76949 [Trifolium repens]